MCKAAVRWAGIGAGLAGEVVAIGDPHSLEVLGRETPILMTASID
jgi:hypothetical protein